MRLRRWPLLGVAVQMVNRGVGLLRQPFPTLTVPVVYGVMFLSGAALLLLLMATRHPWTTSRTLMATGAVTVPYVMFTVWAALAVGLSQFHVTGGDFLLIVWLVGTTWGRLPTTEDTKGGDNAARHITSMGTTSGRCERRHGAS